MPAAAPGQGPGPWAVPSSAVPSGSTGEFWESGGKAVEEAASLAGGVGGLLVHHNHAPRGGAGRVCCPQAGEDLLHLEGSHTSH